MSLGSIGPVHARYMSASLVECVTPAVAPLQIALRVGFGATESVDLVQYGPTITVSGDATSSYVDPPLWLTPATTYVSARSSRIRVADYQQLGALSVDALECEFGQHNFTATTGTNNAPMVHCPTPALMSPGFVVVRISRGFAAASLDAPAILLVKDDHAVRGAHPRQTWGPVDVIAVSGSNFIATHAEGTTDPTTSLCVFGGSGASGGVIVSSALILCESPLTEPTRAKERWVARTAVFRRVRRVHGAPRRRDAHQGARARRPHLHAALVPHEHRRTERMDARRHARARVALRRRRQRIYRLPFRRHARVGASRRRRRRRDRGAGTGRKHRD